MDFLIEGKKIYGIFKSLEGSYLNIKKGKTFISFSNEDFNFTTRLISNEFPNTKMLFEGAEFHYIYKINVEDFTKTIKKLIPFTNWNNPDHTPSLKFDSEFQNVELGLLNSEEHISKSMQVETIKDGGSSGFKIGLNFKYLLEAIENLEDEYIYMKCIDELKPVWIIPQKTDFKALIMPIRTT